MPNPGVDVYVIDEALAGADALATDTTYLLAAAGPTVPVKKVRADDADATINNYLRALFLEGAQQVYLAGYAADGIAKPTPANAIAALPAGPGQVVAPELVTSADHIIVANAAWAQNKVALLNGPAGATVAQLQTLAAAVKAGATTGGRGAAIFAGVGSYPGATQGAAAVQVPWSISVAGMIARVDRTELNPNLAAAGKRGVSRALGITQTGAASATLYTPAEVATLKGYQVNAARIINGQIRNYGFRTIADLDALPHWWDFSGSRTVMAFRAAAAVIDEELVFDQIDGDRVLLDRYEGLLRDELARLHRLGALHGKTPTQAYSVDTGSSVNPIAQIAAGEVVAVVRLKTSPFAEHVVTNIVRRALTAGEL